MFSMPPLSPLLLLTSRNSCARSVPDQKRSSKDSAFSIAAFSCVYLRMMITQDMKENSISTSITSCTGKLASESSLKMFNPLFMAWGVSTTLICKSFGSDRDRGSVPDQAGWNGCGSHALEVHARCAHLSLDKSRPVRPADRLGEQDTG